MLVEEINPFVRFIAEIVFSPQRAYSVSPDCRMFFILRGSGSIVLDETEYAFSVSSVIYIPAGIPYKFISTAPISAVAINFDYDQKRNKQTLTFAPTLTNDPEKYSAYRTDGIISDGGLLNRCIFLHTGAKFLSFIKEIQCESAFRNIYSNEKMSAMLKVLVIDIAREYSLIINSSKGEVNVKRAVEYIHSNYNNDIDNGEIAAAVGYHPYHLSRIFKRSMGVTIHEYINKYRITMAEQLLLSSDKSITSIATEVGFNNTVSFIQNFRSVNGMTPLKYRNYYRQIV